MPEYQTEYGIYEPGCGLDRVHMSWGHDEYVYHAVKDYLPDEALYMLRYHSFYPWHKEGEYTHLTSDVDRSMLKWVRAFNRYDLYSKGSPRPDVQALMPYYHDLVDEFFPNHCAGNRPPVKFVIDRHNCNRRVPAHRRNGRKSRIWPGMDLALRVWREVLS